uniref:GNAT family N-acetyltransferase n=1 Tax=Phenylobacterium glaciei TaxID=2803784 RepID=A0A974P2W9_9CAUL|nr:GNAT family N-acetyltransferase [Phenylobacterium glaciei]
MGGQGLGGRLDLVGDAVQVGGEPHLTCFPGGLGSAFGAEANAGFRPLSDIEVGESGVTSSRMLNLTFHEVDETRWDDFERLFASRGGPKSCWCMVWRATGLETKQTKGAERKAAIEARVRNKTPIGILGYLDDEPVAWCSIAPRPTYRRLGGQEIAGEKPDSVWSLACFFAHRKLRGQGVTSQLIDAAVAHARAKGASVVEAYPVEPGSPSYRFMGYLPTFEASGFDHVAVAGTRRHVMRLKLR